MIMKNYIFHIVIHRLLRVLDTHHFYNVDLGHDIYKFSLIQIDKDKLLTAHQIVIWYCVEIIVGYWTPIMMTLNADL